MSSNEDRVGIVEGIRGWACIAVFLAHALFIFFPFMHGLKINNYAPYFTEMAFFHSPFAFIYSGTSAVFCFFVLSGYILSYAINKGKVIDNAVSLAVKRYPRLALPAVASCLFSYFIMIYFKQDTSLVFWFAKGYGNFDASIFGAIKDGLYTSFFKGGKGNYNWVLWTMKIELFGSLIISLLYILNSFLEYKKTIITIALASILLLSNDMLSITGYSAFMIGMMFFEFGKKLERSHQIIILISGLYLSGFHSESNSYHWMSYLIDKKYTLVIYVLGASMIVYSLINGQIHAISSALTNRFSLTIGKLSFSLYLIHLPILFSFGVLTFNLTVPMLGYFLAFSLSTLVSFFITLALSHFFFICIDKKSMQLSRKISNAVLPLITPTYKRKKIL